MYIAETQAGLMTEVGEHSIFDPSENYPVWTVEPPSNTLKQLLQHYAGWQNIERPADQVAVAN